VISLNSTGGAMCASGLRRGGAVLLSLLLLAGCAASTAPTKPPQVALLPPPPVQHDRDSSAAPVPEPASRTPVTKVDEPSTETTVSAAAMAEGHSRPTSTDEPLSPRRRRSIDPTWSIGSFVLYCIPRGLPAASMLGGMLLVLIGMRLTRLRR